MIICIVIFGGISKNAAVLKLTANKELGGFTEESISALKLIVSFAQEETIVDFYAKKALVTREISLVASRKAAVVFGFIRTLIFGFFLYAFYIATIFVEKGLINPQSGEVYTIQEIVAVNQAMIMAMMQLLSILPNVTNVAKAQIVGKKVFDILERLPEIRNNAAGEKSKATNIALKDTIEFNKVRFRYPTAPETQPDTLQGVSFKIKAGTSTAIVGPSGSGKSTIVQMIERFYDPISGSISFDSVPLSDFDLSNLRGSIGYVSQEPTLILGSIKENMLFSNKNASDADIQAALDKANANFVSELEHGIETYVGSTTIMNMSGGQKQRLAIARALVKNPKILILDEATSALDPKSEQEVQQAITRIQNLEQNKLTIIMIAHRLQTIETAQNLLYINSPKEILAAEKGSKEYDIIMNLLKTEKYKHQDKESEEIPEESSYDYEIPGERTEGALAELNDEALGFDGDDDANNLENLMGGDPELDKKLSLQKKESKKSRKNSEFEETMAGPLSLSKVVEE